MGDIPDSDIRLVQVARMLDLGSHTVDAERALAEIAVRPGDFAGALFEEAAANDDVTSVAAAIDYLDDRLRYFDDLVDGATAGAVRAAFGALAAAWDQASPHA